MWIKICANTNLEDTLLAADLGANAVGFIFAPSPRQVTVQQVAHITPYLPSHLERVGVFPALDAAEIASTAQQAHLTAVQLHGGFSLTLLEQLQRRLEEHTTIIQTINWMVDSTGAAATEIATQLQQIASQGIARRVLIDSKIGQAGGGTGIPFDWIAARAVFAEAAAGLDLIVAGGLRPENVVQAITALAPWGIDVASGVEAAPGKKSPEKLAAFIQNVRRFA